MEHFTILSNFMHRSVTTMHWPLSFQDMATLFELFNTVPLVSISEDQRKHLASKPNWVGTVLHGIPKDMFPFTAHPRPNGTPYLAFLGRITDVKRPEWAIQIAVKAGIPLRIAAKLDKVDVTFWEQEVKPLVEKHSDLVEYIGEINDAQKGAFLGNALALLFPIDWDEPFGLVMIESMACGTPVNGMGILIFLVIFRIFSKIAKIFFIIEKMD
jgi:glycosyltransferase involved in cell wall biosynthesis